MGAELGMAAVGGSVLTEGIKFLYGQAAELLKQRRERRKKDTGEASGLGENLAEPPDDVFEGEPRLGEVDETVLSKVEGDLCELLEQPALVRVGALGWEADPADLSLIHAADALRLLLEQIHRQRITFQGEANRSPSGPLVVGEVAAETVDGLLAAVRVRRIAGGAVHGMTTAGRVTGEAVGVDADIIE